MPDQSSTSSIHRLPHLLINQIKAGEVIERPSHILKELMENAIDAGPNCIKVTIQNNGLDLLAVEDNGVGIKHEECPLAFDRHATSKLVNFEDLYDLATFGFRGEALASMVSVSKMTCLTRRQDQIEGTKYVCEGGQERQHIPYPRQEAGTSMFVRELFYNTPVRLKFIKSKAAEKSALKRVFNSFLLTYPQVEFQLKWDDHEKQIFKANQDLTEERLKKVLVPNRKEKVILKHIQAEFDGHSINGVITVSGERGSLKNQFIFVNDRCIQDKSLHHVLSQTAKFYWPEGIVSPYVLFIRCPHSQLDVNIHPNKTVVKFENPSIISSLLSSSLRKQNRIEESSSFKNADHIDTIKDLTQSQFTKHISHAELSTKKSWYVFEKKFLLIKKDQLDLVIHTENLCHYLFDLLKHESSWNRETPLLIAEPFQTSFKRLDFLKQLGFHCEHLNSQQVVLRSIPYLFEFLNYTEVFSQFFQASGVSDQDQENFLMALNAVPPQSHHGLLDLIMSLDFESLRLSQVLSPLTEKHLLHLFES